MGLMRAFSSGSEMVTISYDDPEMAFEDANGVGNIVFTDGRVVVREEEGGGKTKVKTRWKKNRLIVSVTFPTMSSDGQMVSPSVNLTYEIDQDGRLRVSTTVGVGGRTPPFTVERVYDLAEADS